MIKIIKLLASLIFLFSQISQAQNYNLLNYDNENGMHNNSIKAIVQDSLGFIWIATDNYLERFDGINFKLFNKGLPSSFVKNLYLTKKKQLLAITDMGVVEIVSKPDTAFFKPILSGTGDLTDSALYFPKTVFEDTDGSLWFSCTMAINHFKNNKLKEYTFEKKNFTGNYFCSYSIVKDSSGNLFAFSNGGYAYKYDLKTDSFIEMTNLGHFPFIYDALCNRTGEILLATSSGLHVLKYDKDLHFSVSVLIPDLSFIKFRVDTNHTIFAASQNDGIFLLNKINNSYQIDKIQNLIQKSIHNIYIDKENNIWVSTDAGIVLMNLTFFEAKTEGINHTFINCIVKGTDNSMYVVANGQVQKLDIENKHVLTSLFLSDRKYGFINYFLPIGKRFFWASNAKEMGWCDDTKNNRMKFAESSAILLHGDNNGDVWVCKENIEGVSRVHSDADLFYYDKTSGLPNRTYSMDLDMDGNLLAGSCTDSTYLHQYDKKTDRFKNISITIKFEHNKYFMVNDICVINKLIYLATTDGLYLIENKQISRVPVRNFENTDTRFVKVDKNNNLWLGYDKGLIKYNKQNTIFFDKKDGLPVNSMALRSIVISDDNCVFAGTTNGWIYSLKNNEPELITPAPFFSSIKFDGIDSSKISKITEDAYSTIRFISLSFPGKDIKYQTRILEQDTVWSKETYSNELFIPKLKTGAYTVQVRALQHGNYRWSKVATYQFTVRKHWYNTWLAYVCYVLFIFIFVYVTVIFYTRRLRKQKENLEQIVKERTVEIVQQKEEIETQAEELKTTNDKLVELDQFKEGMTGMIVHDLKNPLAAILNVSNNDETKQAAKQMLNMVLNILDVQKLEDAQMNIQLTDFNLSTCLFDALQQVKLLYERKSITIENSIPENLTVKGDAEIIQRVFINLLTNAVKYTPNNGKIELGIKNYELGMEKQDIQFQIPNSKFQIIKVSDNGCGIPKDKLISVFDKFVQVEAKNSGGVRSTGLGLTFCKLAVEAHGGKIGVESEIGKGSTFWFLLLKSEKIIENNYDQNKTENQSETIQFNNKEKEYLLPFKEILAKFTVYEFSDIRNTIQNIDSLNNSKIETWKNLVMSAMKVGNEEKYNELIKQ